jgi:hypothetical protein
MDETGQGIVLSSPPKCGVPVARVGRIDRRIREVTSRLDAICTLVTIDS